MEPQINIVMAPPGVKKFDAKYDWSTIRWSSFITH